MKRSLTVFLCSTQGDLIPEREAVLAAVQRLQLQHDSMELFGARDGRPLETCLAEVRRSDVLVVVLGHRYGTFVPGRDISYTEAEYQEGHRLRKPCLVYFRNDDVPVLPRHVERDPNGIRALDRFKSELRDRHTVTSFTASEDLAVGVAVDLGRLVLALAEAEQLEAQGTTVPPRPLVEQLAEIVGVASNEGVSDQALLDEVRRAVSGLAAAEGKRRPLVFLSHAASDNDRVRAFATALRSHGLEVWHDEERIGAGQGIFETVVRGLEAADCLAAFVSDASLESPWVDKEISIVTAQRLSTRGKRPYVIPVLLDDVGLPSPLRDVKYIDLRGGQVDNAADEFARALARHLETPEPPAKSGDYSYLLEKNIHALRLLLHTRATHPDSVVSPGRASLQFAIEDVAKSVGALCGLAVVPNENLHKFVSRVLAAKEGRDLVQVFRTMPELVQFLTFPYFSSGDAPEV